MNWYYAEGNQQQGPVSEARLEELLITGKITPETLVWREGLPNWQAYKLVQAGTAAGTAAPGGVVCSQCGKSFPPDEVIQYGEKSICAACKPIFIQRLREGVDPHQPGEGYISEAELLSRDYEVSVGERLSEGWQTFKNNAGGIIGASILVYLVMLAGNMIPILGVICSLVLSGPLMGGLWLYYIRCVRDEGPSIGDAFGGFGPRFVPLMLTSVVSALLTYLCMLPFAVACGVLVASAGGKGYHGMDYFTSATPVLQALAGITLLIGLFGVVYLSTCWIFALPLVADKRMSFWPAMQLSRQMVGRHWWAMFAMLAISGVLSMLGAILCFVGMLVTAPVALLMIASHYQKVFGPLQPVGD